MVGDAWGGVYGLCCVCGLGVVGERLGVRAWCEGMADPAKADQIKRTPTRVIVYTNH